LDLRTSSGLELLLRLDPRAALPLRVQLEQQLREAVRAGSLAPGTALPSSRALAAEVEVSRGLVVEAYSQLVAEGYLVTRAGGATRVSDAARFQAAAARLPDEPRAPRYDFRPGAPDVALFPRRAWLASLRRALTDAPQARFDYGDPRGASELRVTLSQYLGRVRGVMAHPDAIVVTSGLAQGLAIFGRALAARGDRRIGVEDPGSAPLRRQMEAAGLQAVPLPVDADGVRTDALGDLPAVVLTPAHQFPTGVVLAPQRRAALLEWADRTGAVIVEDDYDAEDRYDRAPVGAIQGLDPRNVLYCGSVSKTLAPGLRLGWLVAPEHLAAAIAEEKARDDLGTPVVEQLALADFIERGELDRHLRASRLEYRRRRDALVDGLARELPAARVGGIAAGLHVAAYLPEGVDEARVLEAARERGVAAQGLSEHRTAPGPSALLLGYGRTSVPAIAAGVRALATAVRAELNPRAR
jgi:GntR family transcriptional regulator/MocR family aminotransferase